MKTVTRTYVNKKGEVITKTYTYDKNYSNQDVNQKNIITKSGKISKKIDKILDTIEDTEEREFIKRKIKQFSAEMQDKERKKKAVSLQTFKTMYQADRINILFENMNTSVEELVQDLKLKGYNIEDTWILDNSHWEFKGLNKANPEPMLTLPSGDTAVVEFHYPDGYELVIQKKQIIEEDVGD